MLVIGKRLRILREIRGYSQEYMSTFLNITQSAYSKMERGEVRIDMTRLEKLAEILKLQPYDLIEGNYTINIYPQGSVAREDIEIRNDHENTVQISHDLSMFKERNKLLTDQVRWLEMQIDYLKKENSDLNQLLKTAKQN